MKKKLDIDNFHWLAKIRIANRCLAETIRKGRLSVGLGYHFKESVSMPRGNWEDPLRAWYRKKRGFDVTFDRKGIKTANSYKYKPGLEWIFHAGSYQNYLNPELQLQALQQIRTIPGVAARLKISLIGNQTIQRGKKYEV